MTKKDNKQRIKNEALNKIRKIYDPKSNLPYSDYHTDDGSYTDQRDSWVREIIEKMEKEISEL